MVALGRHWFPYLVLAAATAGLLGCGTHNSQRKERALPSRLERLDRGLSAAGRFLIARQSADGAWRSDTYGSFRDGGSLTPLVLQALLALPESDDIIASAEKGAAYLAGLVQPSDIIDAGPYGLSYPVYTAALAVQVLSQPRNAVYSHARTVWLAYLRQRQLTEGLGWQPSDQEYGGWGFASGLPYKPKPGEPAPPLTESNLSATVFALEALRKAGCPADDVAVRAARTFVERCQNYPQKSQQPDRRFDDGGFFFIYDDSVRNKAGVAGRDGHGRERYVSYGSTTADGLRALLACGLPPTHGRVRAAREWLARHFTVQTHPGNYPPEREGARTAVYYYYSWSIAQALSALALEELPTPTGAVRWAEALADALLERQRDNGAWSNPAKAVREDDPILATSLAAAALALCRAGLQGEPPSLERDAR